jgi:hypothetical protein
MRCGSVPMPITIRFDKSAPTASAEFMIASPLRDFEQKEIEAGTPRGTEAVLVSEKFRRLTHEARAITERELAGSNLQIVRIAGMICHDVSVYRPGIRLQVRERGRDGQFSEEAREQFTAIAERVREALKLS